MNGNGFRWVEDGFMEHMGKGGTQNKAKKVHKRVIRTNFGMYGDGAKTQ